MQLPSTNPFEGSAFYSVSGNFTYHFTQSGSETYRGPQKILVEKRPFSPAMTHMASGTKTSNLTWKPLTTEQLIGRTTDRVAWATGCYDTWSGDEYEIGRANMPADLEIYVSTNYLAVYLVKSANNQVTWGEQSVDVDHTFQCSAIATLISVAV